MKIEIYTYHASSRCLASWLKIGITLLFLTLSVFRSGNAQEQFRYNAEAETLFNEGLKLYREASYENAAEMFETSININPVHQRMTASYIMGAKSWLNLNEEAQAMFLLNNLLKRFPESGYTNETHYTLGITYFYLKEYPLCVKEFLKVTGDNSSSGRSIQVKSLLDSIVTFVLTTQETDDIIHDTQSEYIKEIVVRNSMRQLDTTALYKPPVHTRRKTKTFRVGVLLPLLSTVSSSSVKSASEELLEGIKTAKAQFDDSDTEYEIILDIQDTELDSVHAKSIVEEFAGEKECIAAIGPLYSNTAHSVAPVAAERKLPLIVPLANGVGIASAGEYVFQANADLAMQGKAMAQYAIQQLGFTSLAVIAPATQIASMLSTAFISEAKRLGATITADEHYSENGNDLSQQFTALRKSSMNAEPQVSFEKKISKTLRKRIISSGAPAKLVDSMMLAKGRIPVSKLFGKNGLRTANALNLTIINPRSAANNVEIPVTSIQGIYVPIENPEDIGIISSQLMYYNIKTQILGSAVWYNETQLGTQLRYADGVIFCSDYFIDELDSAYLAIEYYAKKQQTKYFLFGYDAMRLVLSGIEKGVNSRSQLREYLSNLQYFPGIHSTITLKGERVNKTLQILQFDGGVVKRITEVTVE